MKRGIVTFLLLLASIIARPSLAQVGISVTFGPPPLPVYSQPACPDDGFIWTPGYWAYDNYFGYYWIPGTWVRAPQPGLLWTPGWWGWGGGAFLFHEGYWAPHVGFYGGINYGFGFFGNGYAGGRWDGDHFYYNRAVSNVNVTNIHNVYNTTVVNNVTVNHISYNGGTGGIEARPTHEEEASAQQSHVAMQASQLRHQQMARANPQLRAEVNHGKPAIAATARPAAFTTSAVAARAAGGAYQAPERRLDHASSVAAHQAPSPLRGENPTQQASHETGQGSQAHQQQEQALVDRQNQQHAQLQARQEREHEQAQQKNFGEQRQQEMEQRHAQQTAHMEQQHMQQMHAAQRPPTPSRPSEQAPGRPNEPAHGESKSPHR